MEQNDKTQKEPIWNSANVETGNLQLEDKILKTAAQFFGEDLLPIMGIKGTIRYVVPTEQIHLEARRLEEDFNFAMEDGTLRHLEFESDSIAIKDLRRFREYEAYMSMSYQAPVITTVICTSNVRVLKDSLTEGINSYKVEVVRMKNHDADWVFKKVEECFFQNKPLTKEELLQVLLTPLMSGGMTIKERIFRGLEIIRAVQSELEQEKLRRMESVLYALAVKLLEKGDLEQVKERFGMTVLGQMLMEDGVKKGIQEGVKEGLERVNRLNLILAQQNRTDDIIKAAGDIEWQKKLFEEFGI